MGLMIPKSYIARFELTEKQQNESNIVSEFDLDPGPPPMLNIINSKIFECKGCGAIIKINEKCEYCGRER